ncbi:hypothetical protein ARMSODRAFT_947337 [Armillaria solidipes]|uniref:Uncharacterized protein n=1 Tax=Armillaria solidipes TaxID=1076256 RepID=A0A2H3C979_9AGAR|nr:hypothetical protein ARMSODRAFT_947337 [Armillaria solidipes]
MKGLMKSKKAVEAFEIKESMAASGCSQKLDTVQVHANVLLFEPGHYTSALIMTTTFTGSVLKKAMINAILCHNLRSGEAQFTEEDRAGGKRKRMEGDARGCPGLRRRGRPI